MTSPNQPPPSQNPEQPPVLEPPDAAAAADPGAGSSADYSALTKRQKMVVLCLASFAATFSPLSSFIFFPAISDLSRALDVSVGRINLTITSYMIVA
ncbi:hypothetical protein CMUS01_12199, partial [Colletotrichum musicola]